MLKIVKKTLILLIFIASMLNYAFAFDLDETVDDEIRKNYNSSKLVNDMKIDLSNVEETESLPELPSVTKQNISTNKQTTTNQIQKQTVPQIITYNGGNVKIGAGKSFNVSNITKISDWQTTGTKVQFKTTKITNGKHYTIPAGTLFNGEIVESHQPQITCNGGLVVIRVYSMKYKNQFIPINAHITRANDKKIFFNNIKGKRTYLQTMYKKGNWGRSLFSKMLNLTVQLGGETSTLILSPFPIAYGTICLGLNTLTSPITAFFSKGGHVSIPSGSQFRIKFDENAYID